MEPTNPQIARNRKPEPLINAMQEIESSDGDCCRYEGQEGPVVGKGLGPGVLMFEGAAHERLLLGTR